MSSSVSPQTVCERQVQVVSGHHSEMNGTVVEFGSVTVQRWTTMIATLRLSSMLYARNLLNLKAHHWRSH